MFHFLVVLASCFAAQDEDWKDVTPKELGLEWVKPAKDEKTGFTVGGRNETASIAKLTHLKGQSIEELEKVMRPGASSTKGFLGKDESLLKVLADDNAYVLDKLGLTHQELARHMLTLGAIARKKSSKTITYHGRKLFVQSIDFRGKVPSPFKDGTFTNTEITITNEATGKKLHYSLLVPLMVERYGFYEGRGTPYRVDPARIVEVLDFIAAKKD